MSLEGKQNTDKWFPVRLVDENDGTPETGKVFGGIVCKYGFEGATSESTYAVTTNDWKEQGDGNYWLNVGASEFTSIGKYIIKVECSGCVDSNFTIEVRTSTLNELLSKELGYLSDATVLVANGTTDAARGTNLATAYTAACALTPGGNALSTTNRAVVLIPPGRYLRTATLTLNTNYVDLIATTSASGQACGDNLIPTVKIYTNTDSIYLVTQSVLDIRLTGIKIITSMSNTTVFNISTSGDSSASIYRDCHFSGGAWAVRHTLHVCGVWKNCYCSYGWRCGNNGAVSATMLDCKGEIGSYGGDASGASFGTCRFERCVGGDNCFGGCSGWAIPIGANAIFIECEAGDRSYALGKTCAGKFYRCRGGIGCFGGTVNSSYAGEFSGYAEDCTSGTGSFGGASIGSVNKLTGELLRCKSTGSARPWRLEGAVVEDCLLTVGTTNQDCITLLDGTSVVTNSTIIVVEGGTGIPINAGSAMNVSAVNNRYNNVSAAANGLGVNVTNVGTTNMVDSDTIAISGDVTAADNLEAMLDGTGAVLTLRQLRIAATGAEAGIYVTNIVGAGVTIDGDVNDIVADITGTLSTVTTVTGVAEAGRQAIATELLSLSNGIEAGFTLKQAIRVIAAACVSILSGAGSGTETLKGLDKTTTRAVVTVDSSGNRSAITYTP